MLDPVRFPVCSPVYPGRQKQSGSPAPSCLHSELAGQVTFRQGSAGSSQVEPPNPGGHTHTSSWAGSEIWQEPPLAQGAGTAEHGSCNGNSMLNN